MVTSGNKGIYGVPNFQSLVKASISQPRASYPATFMLLRGACPVSPHNLIVEYQLSYSSIFTSADGGGIPHTSLILLLLQSRLPASRANEWSSFLPSGRQSGPAPAAGPPLGRHPNRHISTLPPSSL